MTSVSGHADDLSYRCSSDTFDPQGRTFDISENWTVLSTEGDKPIPRFYHAAAIVSSKMVVFGGDSGNRLLDDTKILNLEKLTWDSAPPKVCPSPNGCSMKLPACKGHCLLDCCLSFGCFGMNFTYSINVFLLEAGYVMLLWKIVCWTLCLTYLHFDIIQNSKYYKSMIYHSKKAMIVHDDGLFVCTALLLEKYLYMCDVQVPWGNSVILVGGKTEPASDHLSVWTFNTETELWSLIEAKGDIPAARSGHTVIRAGATLILFGGEDTKGKKRHDLHMFDLKSSTWLPLNYKGTGPSPRSNHIATLYDDRVLLIFGGHSKSKTLNDLYSLDFDTMVWSRVKTHGPHPSPRAGCSGTLCGTKWYIAGGASKKKRHAETWVFDVLQCKWSVCVVPPSSSITTKKGFSMVPFYHKDKIALIAFGGNKKEPCNKVEVLVVLQNEHSFSWRSAPEVDTMVYEYSPSNKELADHLHKCAPLYSNSSIARHSLTSVIEHPPRREPLSESLLKQSSLGTSLHTQLDHAEECSLGQKLQKPIDDDRYDDVDDSSSCQDSTPKGPYSKRTGPGFQNGAENMVTGGSKVRRIARCSSDVGQSHLYNTKIADLIRRNTTLEDQLATALASKDQLDKSLASVIHSRGQLEKMLANKDKEAEMLKEKIACLELAQEESNSLSNTVHADNVRLEREVAFLKAVTGETQKARKLDELHSTRRVLAGEQSRAFQLQVEVFHLKQRLQILEGRSGTPNKQPL
ncbi:Galactose oxidase/kelch repeat superfamily protein [Zea mays]|uniref:Galactose oxidase/kelch repeat superfamily protein n=1 Tax=Zea mays TaxID=4577 RepID=A0A1D6IWK0_MAIZE|nr:Galactose oxidase/kelch repeat superfamily protein [Zea mays]